MSRLTDLLRAAKSLDPQLGADLEAEIRPLQARLPFGLNFERHAPEAVELPGHKIRKGNKVRILPPRGSAERGDQILWQVASITGDIATIIPPASMGSDPREALLEDLILAAEFRERIYPGLRHEGTIENSVNKPFHTVINGENFHVLEQLTFTHENSVDLIYIDPPYNTGARDWKYNNDYVENDDLYRHSKWLAFIERRIKIAKKLLKTEESTLIVTIDEKEYLRLGMLLEQIFPEANIQMISSVINPAGVARGGEFARTDEYIFVVMLGSARPKPVALGNEWLGKVGSSVKGKLHWNALVRTGTNSRRVDRPNLFYPIFVAETGDKIISIGEPIPINMDRSSIESLPGTRTIWPLKANGEEANWQISPEALRKSVQDGYVRLGRFNERSMAISYLKSGERKKVEAGLFPVIGHRADGSILVDEAHYVAKFIPGTQWSIPSHDASRNGSNLLSALMPDRKFPFPKSLYAVEDILRFFVSDKPNALILDFFAGSGTTAHAVMRLNRQDGGLRSSISVTNNEVSAEEQKKLREAGFRPGDPEWEKLGICEHITKPRIRAAITGRTPADEPIKGDYKFVDEFPMSEGFEENAAFFTLTYESKWLVGVDRSFTAIAPLLWLRAGAIGPRIDSFQDGWAITTTYGILRDLDDSAAFIEAIRAAENIRIAYIVTDDEGRYQQVADEIRGLETVRLYEDYLRNCEMTGDF